MLSLLLLLLVANKMSFVYLLRFYPPSIDAFATMVFEAPPKPAYCQCAVFAGERVHIGRAGFLLIKVYTSL